MKTFRIALLSFCLCCLLLTACGGKAKTSLLTTTVPLTDTPSKQPTATNTFMPAPTQFSTRALSPTSISLPTSTLTPARYPTRTPLPSFTPAPPTLTSTPITPFITFQNPTVTPALGPEGYRLRHWTEVDAEAAIIEARRIIDSYDSSRPWPYSPYDLEDYMEYLVTLEREALLRPLSDTRRDAIQWDLVSMMISDFNPQFTTEDFKAVLQVDLNAGRVTPDQLKTWLQKRGFQVEDSLSVDNLAGDGKPGLIFQVGTSPNMDYEAVFVLLGASQGTYRVEQITEWYFSIRHTTGFEVGDHDGDGQPEILLMQIYFSRRSETKGFFTLALLEWRTSEQRFVNLTNNLDGLALEWVGYYGDPGFEYTKQNPWPWHFGSADANGVKSIIIPVTYKLGENCPDLASTITYAWDGTQYHWASEVFTPLDTTIPITCQVGWALLRGTQDEQALEVLNTALGDDLADFQSTWGPAARDYLRLQLGILYALHGQQQAAVQTLQTVRDHPEHPEFSMASQLAGTFLDAYPGEGLVLACNRTITFINHALDDQIPRDNSQVYYYLHDSIREKWGIDDPRWNDDGNAICDIQTAFKQSLSYQNPQNLEQFALWLNQAGLPHAMIQSADLTGDGTQDWITVLKLVSDDSWMVWVIVRDGGMLNGVVVNWWYDASENPVLATFTTLRPDPGVPPVGILTLGEDLFVFRLILEEQLSSELLKHEYPINSLMISQASQEFTVLSSWNESMEKTVYSWVPDLQTFVSSKTERLSSPSQDELINRIEDMFFKDTQSAEAIAPLQAMLAGKIREPVYDYEKISLPRIRPYLQYLLGLAYELTGDETNAVRIYWHIWHDYPKNSYALIASHKLELVGP